MYLLWRLLSFPVRLLARNLRPLLAAFVGYTFLGIFAQGGLTVAFAALGSERMLQPESWEVSTAWIAIALAAGALGGFLGGGACQMIDRRGRGTVLLVLGVAVLSWLAYTQADGAGAATELLREGAVTRAEAFRDSIEPTWSLVAQRATALVAILVGVILIHRRGPPSERMVDEYEPEDQ